MVINCTMYAYSTSPHVSQLYTGFSLLAANGNIRLTQKLYNYSRNGKELLKNVKPEDFHGLFVVLNDDKVLFYDTSDAFELRSDALQVADAYFKRSYLSAAIPDRHKSRVYPLGLNYEVYTGKPNWTEVSRFLFRKTVLDNFPRELVRRVAELGSLVFLPTTYNICSPPVLNQEPRVLFMARAWDPDDDPPGLSVEKKVERMQINEMRARCIERLRKELGPNFYGGFAQSTYAMETYKHLLLESALISAKRNYLSLLQQYSICVATTGLHGSIGWKLAEYVAFSKSIVSEPLKYVVPGGFEAPRNYLEFDTPETCVRQTMKLIEDTQCRQQMMDNNWQYYKEHLVPDKLVLKTLNIVNGN